MRFPQRGSGPHSCLSSGTLPAGHRLQSFMSMAGLTVGLAGLYPEDQAGPGWVLQACPGAGPRVLRKEVLLPTFVLRAPRRGFCLSI